MEKKVWVSYVDSRNIPDQRDLDHLISMIWGANKNAMKGDLILVYRTSPFSDIKYVFTALSNARKTEKSDGSDTEYVIDLGNKIILSDPVQLTEIRKDKKLRHWSFARNQQGMLKRQQDIKSEGYWIELRNLILKKNKSQEVIDFLGIKKHGVKSVKKQPPKFKVFISYASENYSKVNLLYRRLVKATRFDYWLDKKKLLPGYNWNKKIEEAIMETDAMIICFSKKANKKNGYLKREITLGLNLADSRPGSKPSIVPVKLEQCDISNSRINKYNYSELFKKGGFSNLVKFLMEAAQKQ
jgi:hypothetical protein